MIMPIEYRSIKVPDGKLCVVIPFFSRLVFHAGKVEFSSYEDRKLVQIQTGKALGVRSVSSKSRRKKKTVNTCCTILVIMTF